MESYDWFFQFFLFLLGVLCATATVNLKSNGVWSREHRAFNIQYVKEVWGVGGGGLQVTHINVICLHFKLSSFILSCTVSCYNAVLHCTAICFYIPPTPGTAKCIDSVVLPFPLLADDTRIA